METTGLYNKIFSKPPSIYWSKTTKIEYVQRRILVHSILYYDYDEQVISNEDYDTMAQLLVRMMKRAEIAAGKSIYAEVFKGYDGSTGFDLLPRLHRINKKEYIKLEEIALMVLTRYKQTRKGAER